MKRVNVVAEHQKRIAPASGAQMREELKNVEVPGHDWNPATLWNQCPKVTLAGGMPDLLAFGDAGVSRAYPADYRTAYREIDGQDLRTFERRNDGRRKAHWVLVRLR
jgi:hypothetical protein